MADSASKQFTVTTQNGHCDGHFPGYPLVPGALQVQWLIDLAAELCPEARGWTITKLKLLREIKPGAEITLSVNSGKFGLKGEITDADGPFSQMTLVAHD